jgi:Cd2+/Zn2+-exporting ATPase
MLTGDNPAPPRRSPPSELGMGWRAGLLPEGKVDEIAKLGLTQRSR